MRTALLLTFIFLISLFSITSVLAQETKVAPTSTELYNTIAHQDSVLFAAFNTQDMDVFKSMFTQDLEWYQDNAGLIPYATIFQSFQNNFNKENKLTRQLVPGTLEVHPIKDYGAIEIGVHQFRHMENGQEIVGTFKFLMIWRNRDDHWKISRVVSYDH